MSGVKLWAYLHISTQGILIPMEKLSALMNDCMFMECGWSGEDLDKYKQVESLPAIRILTDDQVTTILVRDRLRLQEEEEKKKE